MLGLEFELVWAMVLLGFITYILYAVCEVLDRREKKIKDLTAQLEKANKEIEWVNRQPVSLYKIDPQK